MTYVENKNAEISDLFSKFVGGGVLLVVSKKNKWIFVFSASQLIEKRSVNYNANMFIKCSV